MKRINESTFNHELNAIAIGIERTRIMRGWSREWLAKEAGVSVETIRQIEILREYGLAIDVAKILNALGVTDRELCLQAA